MGVGCVEAARAAAGAFALNGRMVDAPFVRRAEFILALAEMIRMPEAGGVEV